MPMEGKQDKAEAGKKETGKKKPTLKNPLETTEKRVQTRDETEGGKERIKNSSICTQGEWEKRGR